MLIQILVAVAVAAVLYYVFSRRKGRAAHPEAELIESFEEMVRHRNLKIDHSVVIGNRILGFDRKSNIFVIVDYNDNQPHQTVVSLNDVISVKMKKEKNTSGNIQKLFLEFKRDENDRERICFYDHRFDKIIHLPAAVRRVLRLKHRIDINRSYIKRKAVVKTGLSM